MNDTSNFDRKLFSNFTLIICDQGSVLYVNVPDQEYSQKVHSIFLVLINIISSLFATVGNGLVIMAIIRSKLLRGPAFIFTGTLCILDFLVGIILQPLYIIRVGYPIFKTENACEVYTWGALILVHVLAKNSLTILSVIAVERFCAVLFPLRYKVIITNFRAAVTVGFVVSISLVNDIVLKFTAHTSTYRTVQSASLGLCYFIMITCYVSIIICMKMKKGQFLNRASVEITRTLASATLVCGICWLPFIISFPLVAKLRSQADPNAFVKILLIFSWTTTLSLANSALNVGIYYFKSTTMRNETRKQIAIMYRYISSALCRRRIFPADNEYRTSNIRSDQLTCEQIQPPSEQM